jgi:hypothetical protein
MIRTTETSTPLIKNGRRENEWNEGNKGRRWLSSERLCRAGQSLTALMKEAVSMSETSVSFYETTRHSVPEDSHLYSRRLENLKSHRRNEVWQEEWKDQKRKTQRYLSQTDEHIPFTSVHVYKPRQSLSVSVEHVFEAKGWRYLTTVQQISYRLILIIVL